MLVPKLKKHIEPWLRQRGYRHFDAPFRSDNTDFLQPDQVSKHAFWPFIGKSKSVLRYKKQEHKVLPKPRELKYASHRDSAIFARYSKLLSDRYEVAVAERRIGDCVLAYRNLPDSPCNIHHARDVFLEIQRRGNCDVVSTDVKDFFDSLRHADIKARWQELLGVERLPPDHFAVFKHICQYRWVDLDHLASAMELTKHSLSRKSAIGKRRTRLSPAEVLRSVLKTPGIVTANTQSKGIPQGSPISALLSNLYMLQVDTILSQYAAETGGIYRRYSDDILFIANEGQLEHVKSKLSEALASVGLALHPDKTAAIEFRVDGEALTSTSPLEYLGFSFDGNRIALRDRTLSCFMHRMIRAVKRAYRATKSNGETKLRRRKLYENFSHKGQNNFIAYANRASRIMYPAVETQTPITHQIRNQWKILHRYIAKAEQKLGESSMST